MRDRITPEVILTNRKARNAEGHKLTYRALADIASSTYRDCPESVDRSILLGQAADQFLRTKRSKAKGHPNGHRSYTSADRQGPGGAPGSASLHGRRPSTTASVPRNPRRLAS